jgi:rhodanese-related sulfurtransferase
MNDTLPSISPPDLADLIGTAGAPIVFDVRSIADLAAIDRLIPGSLHRPQDDVEHLWRELPAKRPVVVCDLSGSQTSWTLVDALRRFGADARYLMDGFAGWYDRGLPTRRHVASPLDKWVTREHPKIDRIACPWLISRFVNPLGEFIYVPQSDVLIVAKQTGAIPYDIKDVEFGHVCDRCSFDAIVRILDMKDPARGRTPKAECLWQEGDCHIRPGRCIVLGGQRFAAFPWRIRRGNRTVGWRDRTLL